MAVKTAYRTVIVCDGSGGLCPLEAVLNIDQAPNAAIRRAVKAGWSMTDENLCPACHGTSVVDVITLPQPPAASRPRNVPGAPGVVHQFKTRGELEAGSSDPSYLTACQRLIA